MKVSFIGLGIMGSRMAANLLENNIDLTVYNRSEEPSHRLKALGAKIAESPQACVLNADMVITMLSRPEVVNELMIKSGALKSMKNDSIWLDCSTVNPSFSKEMAVLSSQNEIRFMDTPVAGTKPHAENAELVFFAGGNKDTLESARPIMEMMGNKILHIGDVGQGSSFKMLVNMMLGQSMLIFSEALLLGEKLGMEKEFLLNSLPGLVVAAPFTKFKAEAIRNNDYEVQFPLEHMYKDFLLAAQSAMEMEQELVLASRATELYGEALGAGLGRLDFSAIHKFLEERS